MVTISLSQQGSERTSVSAPAGPPLSPLPPPTPWWTPAPPQQPSEMHTRVLTLPTDRCARAPTRTWKSLSTARSAWNSSSVYLSCISAVMVCGSELCSPDCHKEKMIKLQKPLRWLDLPEFRLSRNQTEATETVGWRRAPPGKKGVLLLALDKVPGTKDKHTCVTSVRLITWVSK